MSTPKIGHQFTFPASINPCGQCGKSHEALTAWPVRQGDGPHTHFAVCPVTQGHITIKVASYKPETLIKGGGGQRADRP